MSARRMVFTRLLVLGVLLVSGLLAALPPHTPAAAAPVGQSSSLPASDSGRWLIKLQAPPLAQAPLTRPEFATLELPRAANGRLQVNSAAAQQYVGQLQQQQQLFARTLGQMFPAAQVQQSYQVVFNGLAVALPGASPADIERLRALPDVVEVYPDLAYRPQMFASLPLINAPALWENGAIGGQANAGAGVNIAVLDSGIMIDNPFFDPAGFSYPEGYPRGETGFTTPKVIVARAYFRPDLPPLPGSETPLPGPEDSSHGSHVAGIAAGNANVTATVAGVSQEISGVAPRAHLMNYKVFYANDSVFSGSGFTVEIVAALEDTVIDGADVINNSWGGRADVPPEFDLSTQAAEAAVDAGVVVVFSAGNSGPDLSTAGSPAFSDKLISVGAATKPETIAAGFVDVVAPEGVPEDLTGRPFGPADFGEPVRDQLIGPAPFLPALTVEPTGQACDPLPEASMAGQIAVVERGVCEFSVKAYNVQQAGAVAAIIYNSEAGGEGLIAMAAGTNAELVTIPTVFVQRSMGVGMLNWYADAGPAALAQIDPQGRIIEQTPDVLIDFSSRGPSFQGTLKPDVVAPGVNILSAGFMPFAEGIDQHLGFGLSSGTSMSGPHVAGGAALLRQVHPDWSTAEVKSALMSTATLPLWLDEDQTQPAGVLDQGAGRIDLARAAEPVLLFDRPSLSFGDLGTVSGEPTRREAVVQARNISGAPQTYSLSTRTTDGPAFGISVAPQQITLGPEEVASFTVSIEIPADAPAIDYGGLVELAGPQPLHIPVWVRTLPPDEERAKILLIDNDGSTSLGLPDYSGYYGNALGQLALDFTYLDVDALAPAEQTLPALGELQRYEIIIWFTGDNFVPSGALGVPTPLTSVDQNVLIAYLQSGGRLLATGQDLTDASDIEQVPPDPRYGRSDLYHAYLGARWVQDNVFAPFFEGNESPELFAEGVGPQVWAQGVQLDLSLLPAGVVPTGETGASNQVTVDEITVVDADPRTPDEFTTPFLSAVVPGSESGTAIALNRTSQPTLEEPGLPLPYRSIYLSFGIEGIRDDTGMVQRHEFLQALLYWLVDSPTVSLSPEVATVTEANQSVSFSAEAQSNTPTFFVRYRWNFGDGSPIVETAEPTVSHSYAAPGSYQVQVEATNAWGHTALSPLAAPPPVAAAPGAGAGLGAQGATPASPAAAPVSFPETGQTLGGRFLEFWQQHGGLPVFGYPITPQQQAEQTTQIFERARFELHPANTPPYDVLLGHLGVEALTAQGRVWQDFATVEAAPAGCLYFEQTRHSLCGEFRAYWERHGLEFDGVAGSSYAESLALFGLPISEPREEVLEDGNTYVVQWFERARFELHPQNEEPYRVQLGLLSRVQADGGALEGQLLEAPAQE